MEQVIVESFSVGLVSDDNETVLQAGYCIANQFFESVVKQLNVLAAFDVSAVVKFPCGFVSGYCQFHNGHPFVRV